MKNKEVPLVTKNEMPVAMTKEIHSHIVDRLQNMMAQTMMATSYSVNRRSWIAA